LSNVAEIMIYNSLMYISPADGGAY
jgi:hypothetical protein